MTSSDAIPPRAGGSGAYRAATAIAVVTSLLTAWTTVVHDDGNGAGFFMLILAVAVGWFAADFRGAGMARTMVGVAVMQAALGSLIATAPVTTRVAGGSANVLLFNGAFALLWLASAACFRAAAKNEREAGRSG
jgi:hypothetical protein